MTSTDERLAKMTMRRGRRVPAAARSELPPSLRWPALVQSAALMRFRHSFVPAMQRRYGDAFTVQLVPENRSMVLFKGVDRVKEIFAGDPEVFHAGKGNAVLGPVMGEHSLLLVDGARHKRARKLLMPAFRSSVMKDYETVVTQLARDEVARWTPGAEFRSLERMNALTLEVILQVVFGVADEERLARLRPLVNATVDIKPLVLLGWGYPRLHRFGPWRKVVDVQRELDALLYAEIAERRQAADLHDRTDVLSRLLLVGDSEGEEPLSDAELRDQLVTLLLAGHETTAAALSWALYELGLDEPLMRRAQKAADEGDDDHLEAVMKESMRLHPIIPMVVRFLMAPATIGGFRLPGGISVGPSIILAHRDPESFPEPSRFRPERFLEGEVAPNTWIPFGGGVRRCIGAGFSLMEGVAALREVLIAYDVVVLDGHTDKPRVRNITSVPDKGARIVVHRRRSVPCAASRGPERADGTQ
jgi:cytochrome P450